MYQIDERTQEIIDIRNQTKSLGLDGASVVVALTTEELSACYNGTGADWMPASARAALDGFCAPFLPAVMVHDVETSLSDGSRETFDEVNRRFLANCQTCAMDAYPWYSWKRYALLVQARIMYDAVDEFGWKAWTDAYTDAHIN